jgi:hypothetical protein
MSDTPKPKEDDKVVKSPPPPAEKAKPAEAPAEAPAAPAPARPKRHTGAPVVPSNKELDRLKKARFGDRPGTIHLDTDLATGKTTLVYVDGDGNELSRETYRPPDEKAAKAEGK